MWRLLNRDCNECVTTTRESEPGGVPALGSPVHLNESFGTDSLSRLSRHSKVFRWIFSNKYSLSSLNYNVLYYIYAL